MSTSTSRERRSWTAKEDKLLRRAVAIEDPGATSPSKWHAIAKHVPGRTNKDCRKRWFAKMASAVVKGGWAPDEDTRLINAIKEHGTRWSVVASLVRTRNSDQCAKRWTDTLNPAIDRTSWSSEADALLLRAVEEHGKVWTKIVKTYFPGRTGLAAKNRYNSITRFSSDTRRHRRSSNASSQTAEYNCSSSSRSCASSGPDSPVLPRTPLDSPIALDLGSSGDNKSDLWSFFMPNEDGLLNSSDLEYISDPSSPHSPLLSQSPVLLPNHSPLVPDGAPRTLSEFLQPMSPGRVDPHMHSLVGMDFPGTSDASTFSQKVAAAAAASVEFHTPSASDIGALLHLHHFSGFARTPVLPPLASPVAVPASTTADQWALRSLDFPINAIVRDFPTLF